MNDLVRMCYRQIFEQSPAFLALLEGRDHRIVFANRAYHQLVGDRDVVGLAVREAFPEIEAQRPFEILHKVFLSGEPFIGRGAEVLLRSADGQLVKRRLDFMYQPFRDAAGSVTGILVNGTDVTASSDATDSL
jgi:PAS domain S-box-containing protein